MQEKFITCPRDCYDSCSMIVTINDNNEVVNIKPDSQNPLTQNFLCPRGSKDLEHLTKNRIENPAIKKDNLFQNTDWKNAINLVANKIQNTINEFGRESILYLDYAGYTGQINNNFVKRFWNFIGVTQTDWSLCTKSGHTGIALHYGNTHGVFPDELPNKKIIVFWGFNPIVSSPHIWKQALIAKKENNAKIITIDPIETQTAKNSDLFLQIEPNTDIVLVYGIIKLFIDNNLEDKIFINENTYGFDFLKEEANKWDLAQVEKITTIPANKIKELADLYSKNKSSATMIGIAVQKSENGADKARAISLLPAVIGEGRGFFYSNGLASYFDENLVAGENLFEKKSKIVNQVSLSKYIKNGDFKMIFVNSMNPLETLPNCDEIKESILKNNIFLVVCDTHYSTTAKFADVVLPASSFLEKEDFVLPWGHQYVRYSEQAIKPIFNSKPEIEIIRLLADELNIKEPKIYENEKELIARILNNSLEQKTDIFFEKKEVSKIKIKPINVYPTKSGKIEFYSQTALEQNIEPIPIFRQVIQKYNFTLLTPAVAKHTNSQFTEIYGEISNLLHINELDARNLNISDSDKIELSNENGTIILIAKTCNSVKTGVVWAARMTKDFDGKNINTLITSENQKIGNGPKFHSTQVRLKKV